jgi:hypothetical protein
MPVIASRPPPHRAHLHDDMRAILIAAALVTGCTVGDGARAVSEPRPRPAAETIPSDVLDHSDPGRELARDVREPWSLSLGLQDLVRWWKDTPRRGYTGRDGREAERRRLLRQRRR